LNLSWAKKDESIDELRQKMEKRYAASKESSGASGSMKKGIQRYFETQGKKTAAESDDED
jgi:hypothetical protein